MSRPFRQAFTESYRARVVLLIVVAPLVLGACGRRAPSSSAPLPELKLDVLTAVGGHLAYCDPDIYPVGRDSALTNAKRRLPSIQADAVTYDAILKREHTAPGTALTPSQVIAINEDYKQIQAMTLVPSGDGYSFKVEIPSADALTESVSGSVSRSGAVRLVSRGAGAPLNCPICLAEGDNVDTPAGPVPVEEIPVGMPVWTTDPSGRVIRGVVMETGRMLAPMGHEMVRLTLRDGRSVVASPGHPTADGRLLGDLRPGDHLDGSRVAGTVLVPYRGTFTYDLLPSGPTGSYFVDGVLLGSTLAQARRLNPVHQEFARRSSIAGSGEAFEVGGT